MSTLISQAPPPASLRDELVATAMLDLLGPAGGPREEVDENVVRERYLVGVLAPRRQDLIPEETPEGQDEFSVAGSGTAEEGNTEPSVLPVRMLFPSSFGMSFCVDLEAAEFQLEARWGQYLKEPSETLTGKGGEAKLVWKRYPRGGGPQSFPLRDGAVTEWSPDPECLEVSVKGKVRRRPDHWSVTLFLVNGQEEPKKNKDQAWLFQPELVVSATESSAIFHRRQVPRGLGKNDPAGYAEERAMAMLYRNRNEFAIGHGVSIHAEEAPNLPDRAVSIRTSVIPSARVTQATGPTAEDFPKLKGLVLDMKELAETPAGELAAKIEPLLIAYKAWIDERDEEGRSPELAPHRDAATEAVSRCRRAWDRIREGLDLLLGDETAADAFRFANRAMWFQRIQTIAAERKRQGGNADRNSVDVPENRSWRPFQLAFVLLNLPGITKLDHPDRVDETEATCDLLWFATGGGKTEAYLGLSAYTIGLRRLKGDIAGRSSEAGIAVLMR